MRIFAIRALREFWEKHSDAEGPLRSWYGEASAADWSTPAEVKTMYRSAGVIGDNRVVFYTGDNRYRLIVRFNYPNRVGYVRFIGTHSEYDRINAETI